VPEELRQFTEGRDVSFATSKTGWAASYVYEGWAAEFCAWLDRYRETLPEGERDKPALLFVDGAASHISLKACRMFAKHNIICITMVPHCTHIIQPIDVCFAKWFKAEFSDLYRKLIEAGEVELYVGDRPWRSAAARQRMVVAYCANIAFQKTRQEFTCTRAWNIAGLSEQALRDHGEKIWRHSRFILDHREDYDAEMMAAADRPGVLHTGSQVLTDPGFMRLLKQRLPGKKPAKDAAETAEQPSGTSDEEDEDAPAEEEAVDVAEEEDGLLEIAEPLLEAEEVDEIAPAICSSVDEQDDPSPAGNVPGRKRAWLEQGEPLPKRLTLGPEGEDPGPGPARGRGRGRRG
jgi:hypothetical protein